MMRVVLSLLFGLGLSSALVLQKRRIVETISFENGNLVRNVVDDGLFGGEGGYSWTDANVFLENGWPTAVDVRHGDYVDGLSMKYGDTWAEFHGGEGGSLKSCDWGSEDRVMVVQGRAGKGSTPLIMGLEFITTNGQVCGPYGGGVYGETWISAHPGCFLEYLSGNSGDAIDGLSLHWVC